MPFCPTSSVRVNDRYGIKIRNGYVIRLDANQGSIFFMGVVNSQVSSSSSALIHQPKIGKCGKSGPGNITKCAGTNIRKQIEENGE